MRKKKIYICDRHCWTVTKSNQSKLAKITYSMSPAVLYLNVECRLHVTWSDQNSIKKKFLEELIANFPFTRSETHSKRRVQQLYYYRMCIRCRGNVLPGRLLATVGGYTCGHGLMEGIYEVHRWDGLRCHEDWFKHSKVDRVGTQTHRQEDRVSTQCFKQRLLHHTGSEQTSLTIQNLC
jgi:hypothetical protein